MGLAADSWRERTVERWWEACAMPDAIKGWVRDASGLGRENGTSVTVPAAPQLGCQGW